MADPVSNLPPELDALELELPDAHDPSANPGASNLNGLDTWQRWTVKNVFDTQPKKRAAYMKRLGYELGKDNESYRPLGSTGSFEPIEPDGKDFLPAWNLFTKEGWQELGRDFGDVAYDFGIAAPTIAAMTGAGAAAGTSLGAAKGGTLGAAGGTAVAPGPGTVAGGAAGVTIGGILGGLGGAFTGGAGGHAVSETIKDQIADAFLDEEIPLDQQELLYGSLVTGFLSAAGKGGTDFIKNYKLNKAKNLQAALKEAAVRKSNGTWNQELATKMAESPEQFTPEAVKGSQEKLVDFADSVFGTSVENPKSTRQLRGGVARAAIEPLNDRADLEIQKLSKTPEANFTVDELVGILKEQTKTLAKKKFKTQDEERAIAFFRDEITKLKDKTRVVKEASTIIDPSTGRPFGDATGAAEEFAELTFGEGRDWLKRVQNAAFEEGPVKDNAVVKGMAHGLKELADTKAGLVGSDLPAINAKRSEILTTYKNMQQVIKDGTLQAAYTGKDRIAKVRTRRAFEEADRVLGTKLAEGAESLQFKAAVENLYNAPAAFGSGSVLADAMREGLKQAPKEAFRYGTVAGAATVLPGVGPALVPPAAALGAVKGFAKGAKEGAAFSSPDNLIQNFSKVKVRVDDLAKNPTVAKQVRQILMNKPAMLSTQADPMIQRFLSTPAPSVQPPLAPPPETASPGGVQGSAPAAAGGPAQAEPQPPMALPPELEELELTLPDL